MAAKSSKDKVPAALEKEYAAIASLTDRFCAEALNEECAILCRAYAAALARKRPSPLLAGKPTTWAAGIVYAMAQMNFLFDKSEEIHTSPDSVGAAFGLAKSTVGNKAADIRRILKIDLADAKWTLPSTQGRNPMLWYLSVDGLVVDIRHCPRDLQAEAFRHGYIPYIPADRGE